MSEQDKAKVWRTLARRAVQKVNFGWWVDKMTPLILILSLVAASAILGVRTAGQLLGSNNSMIWLLSGIGVALVLAIGIGWMMARRHFIRESDGLVRLEDRLKLKNALTTADRGVGQWPETPKITEKINSGLEWNWFRVATPVLISALMVVASFLIPIPSVEAARGAPAEPLAWAQMEDWMESLNEEELIEESAIEEVREKIEELRGQPENEWFSHSSLEATDNLRQTLNQNIDNLGAELETAERDLNALQNYAAQISEEGKEQLLAEYDQALQNMAMNNLPLNQKLMNALKGIDPKQLAQGQMSQMSQKQLNQLREALKKAAGACKDCNGLGQGKGMSLPKLGDMDPALAKMLANCQGPGRGGITRGPGPAPMFFGDENNLKTGNLEGVRNEDFSKAAPGDLLGIGEAEHDTDKTKVGPREAGAVNSVGQGGDTIWRESLMPQEKAVLKRYFK